MNDNKQIPPWLDWVQKIQAIAQNGLTFSKNPFEIERYEQLRALAAEIAENFSQESGREVQRLFSKENGYATPKIDVRGVVFQDDRILLVKERLDGKWTLPGGYADVGESAAENVVREVLEESGFRVRATRLLAVYDRNKHPHEPFIFHLYKMFFLCEIIERTVLNSIETTEAEFFSPENLPELSTPRVTAAQIKRMFELRDTDRADFD